MALPKRNALVLIGCGLGILLCVAVIWETTNQIIARHLPTTHPSTFLLIIFPATLACGTGCYAGLRWRHHRREAHLERFALLAARPEARSSLRLGYWVQAAVPSIAVYPLSIAILAVTAPDSVQLKTSQSPEVWWGTAMAVVAATALFGLLWWLVRRFWSVDTRIDWQRMEVHCRDRNWWRATPWRNVGRIVRFETSGCDQQDIAPTVDEPSGVVDWLFAVTADEFVPIASGDINYWPYFRREHLEQLEELLNRRLAASRAAATA